jgi:hypothetical protein
MSACPILVKPEFSRQIFEKYSNLKFREKTAQWEPSCSMQTDRRRNMTKLIVAFRNLRTRLKIEKRVVKATF